MEAKKGAKHGVKAGYSKILRDNDPFINIFYSPRYALISVTRKYKYELCYARVELIRVIGAFNANSIKCTLGGIHRITGHSLLFVKWHLEKLSFGGYVQNENGFKLTTRAEIINNDVISYFKAHLGQLIDDPIISGIREGKAAYRARNRAKKGY